MIGLFHSSSEECSQVVTRRYSTSFASAIRMLHQDLRAPICNIYGFVRLADEIVDTFHEHDKASLLADFKKDTYAAIAQGISLNPILHSFQRTVNQYGIDQ
ncbi:MAG: phytoene/squalene synthase family protein, partial [Sphingomonadales bacterium]